MLTLNSATADNLYFDIEHKADGNTYPMYETHNAYEIYIIYTGKRNMYRGETLFNMTCGDVLLLPPGIPHRSFGHEAYTGICIEFSDFYIKNNLNEATYRLLKSCFSAPLISLNRNALEAIYEDSKKAISEPDCRKSALKSITQILHGFLSNSIYADKISSDSDLSVISSYIQKNFLNIKGLDDLSTHFKLSKSHLCRVFKQHTGITITGYINALKIQYSCKLLAETNTPISEIYKLCGYNSSQYFNRIFKRTRGITPHQFKTYSRKTQMWNYSD